MYYFVVTFSGDLARTYLESERYASDMEADIRRVRYTSDMEADIISEVRYASDMEADKLLEVRYASDMKPAL